MFHAKINVHLFYKRIIENNFWKFSICNCKFYQNKEEYKKDV